MWVVTLIHSRSNLEWLDEEIGFCRFNPSNIDVGWTVDLLMTNLLPARTFWRVISHHETGEIYYTYKYMILVIVA